MSELLDKKVNAEFEKYFWGSRKLLQAHEKMSDENKKPTRKNDKRILMVGGAL